MEALFTRCDSSSEGKAEITPGWFAVTWRLIPDKSTRRKAHGKWHKISNTENGKSEYRILRFKPTLKGSDTKEDYEIAIDWQAWVKLNDYSGDEKKTLNLKIKEIPRWQYLFMANKHPDPVYRVAGSLGLISLLLGIISLIISFK